MAAKMDEQAGPDRSDAALAQVRARIRKNFPKVAATLRWRRDPQIESRIISGCGRFAIERHGEDPQRRYTARLFPFTIIGHNLLSPDEAKEICDRHAAAMPMPEEKLDAQAIREAARYPT